MLLKIITIFTNCYHLPFILTLALSAYTQHVLVWKSLFSLYPILSLHTLGLHKVFCCFLCLQSIKDWILMICVAALVGIDLTILIIYTVVEFFRGDLTAHQVPNAENSSGTFGVRVTF